MLYVPGQVGASPVIVNINFPAVNVVVVVSVLVADTVIVSPGG